MATLTPRQQKVLAGLASGLSSSEIASALQVSRVTVTRDISSLGRLMGIKENFSGPALVARAAWVGVLEEGARLDRKTGAITYSPLSAVRRSLGLPPKK